MPWTMANAAAPASPMNAVAGPKRKQRKLLHLSGGATCGTGAATPQTSKTKKNCDLIICGGGRLGLSTSENDLTLYSKIIFLAVWNWTYVTARGDESFFYRSDARWRDVSWDGCEQVSWTVGSDKKNRRKILAL
jgi:hypothetical protein